MIYLDYAAATPVRKEVLTAMQPYFTTIYANPSSLHHLGQEARLAVEEARSTIAVQLNCLPAEIIFTSGGTESINLALQGVTKGHIITSSIEHKAVLETCRMLQKKGYSVTYIQPNKQGLINPKDVGNAIRKNTRLISIMYANNEIGTIQPIQRIARIAKKHNILFHTDACQASPHLDLNVSKLDVDLLTLNSSKCYGPKGVGLLYLKKGVKLKPLIHGGAQEAGRRAGTENVPGIVGFSKALELAQKEKRETKRLTALRDWFISEIQRKINNVKLNGHKTKRLPGNINISFKGIDAQQLVQHLSSYGIYVSTGSACTSHEVEKSHVLENINAKEGVRISLGTSTTKRELQEVLTKLTMIVTALRKI